MNAIISEERKRYHQKLVSEKVFTVDKSGIPSNADRASRLSCSVGKYIADRLHASVSDKSVGQTMGSKFEQITMEFLRDTFLKIDLPFPSSWHIIRLGNNNAIKISDFAQYEHLDYLATLMARTPELATTLGMEYTVNPDIVIYRDPVPDTDMNRVQLIVDDQSAFFADLRERDGHLPLLHASISTKWTMRSDRAQNSRTEALNLIRNRKGHLPHIVAVTGEPMPGRIASIAMGTGDIDCVYHFALYELVEAVHQINAEDSIEMLDNLIKGKRLKDISDLSIDLLS